LILLDAHAVVAHLPRSNQIVEDAKDFRPVVDLGWGTVKLDEIERFCLKVRKASFDVGRQVLAVVAIGCVRRGHAPNLGGDDDLLRSFTPQP